MAKNFLRKKIVAFELNFLYKENMIGVFSMEKSRTSSKLGSQLAQARRKRGWRLADMAVRTGRPQARLSEMETGKANSTVENLADAGEVLGLTLMFVPNDKLADVIAVINGSSAQPSPAVYDVPNVLSEVFVDDSEPEDEEPAHGGP